MKKRLPAILLALCLCAALLPAAVLADTLTGACGETAFYTFDMETGELVVSGTGTVSLRETAVYERRAEILRIEIADGVTGIGENAFANCRNLLEISIPDSVTEIGLGAFFRCAALKELTLPPGLTRMEDHLLHGCDKLVSLTIPGGVNSIGDMVFEGCNSLRNVYFDGTLAQWEQVKRVDFSWALVYASVFFLPDDPADDSGLSPWALPELEDAATLGIVPRNALNGDYQAPVTRAVFVKLAMYLLSEQYGYRAGYEFITEYFGEDAEPHVSDFMDAWCASRTNRDGEPYQTASGTVVFDYMPDHTPPFADLEGQREAEYIAMAYSIGVINGKSDAVFDPDGALTREEAASILMRVYRLYGGSVPAGASASYADRTEISDWALADVADVTALGVMYGVEDNRFDPKGRLTLEQAVAVFCRLYENAPVSRKNGNITPLLDSGTEREFIAHTPGRTGYFTVKQEIETDTCYVLAGYRQWRNQTANDFGILLLFKAGGRRDLTYFLAQGTHGHSQNARNIRVNESGDSLYFEQYVDLPFTNSKDGSVYPAGDYAFSVELSTGRYLEIQTIDI